MNPKSRPVISVLTPTWNRAPFLSRVWDGLSRQTFRDFEWIVCDDGSTDRTGEALASLRAVVTVPLTIVRASIHIGKTRMDNEGIRRARGEFTLWNDSDDVLVPNALERLLATWVSIPEIDRDEYVGITALCGDDRGVISTPLPFPGAFDTSWNELRLKFRVDGDMLYFVRSDLLRSCRFPEVDFVVPEQIVWSVFGDRRTRVCSEVLKRVQYGAPNAISFSSRMEYCRGRAYAIATIERNLRSCVRTARQRKWAATTFLRCCIHGEVSLFDALELWGNNSSTSDLLSLLPAAMILAAKDAVQRRVRRTHRQFEAAARCVIVTAEGSRE